MEIPSRYFALPRRANQPKRITNKRKRSSSEHETDRDDHQSTPVQDRAFELYPHEAELPPQIHIQYKHAGLAYSEPLPSEPFPHKPLSTSTKPLRRSEIIEELEALSLKPSTNLEDQIAPRPQASERQKHALVINTIMHRALLEGDYSRASRAFGLLLRSEVSGRAPDLRGRDLWAIGAELILRRARDQLRHGQDQNEFFSRKGLEDLREYFDRLILTYEDVKGKETEPIATFHATFFCLWIGNVCSLQIDEGSATTSPDHNFSNGSSRITKGPSASRESILSSARSIARSIEEVVKSPQYAQSLSLSKLLVSVHAWIRGLS